MNNTPADFQQWIKDHRDLFSAYLERGDSTLIAVDVPNAKIAFDSDDAASFMRKVNEAEAEGNYYVVAGVPGLREAGVLPNRRADWGLPPLKLEATMATALPPTHILGKNRDAVMLDDANANFGKDSDEVANELHLANDQIKQLRAELALYRGYHDKFRERFDCAPGQTLEERFDVICQQALQTCYLIEAMPASEQATVAVTSASAVLTALSDHGSITSRPSVVTT